MDRMLVDRLAVMFAARVTRRRGIVSVALLAAAVPAALARGGEDAEAKRGKKRKRKPKTPPELCLREGGACTTAGVCCSGTCDFLVNNGSCALCRGRSCSAEKPCCGGSSCIAGHCDGCRDRATSCTTHAQCCFSNCSNGACLSTLGGPCARNVDCRSCYLSRNCTNACVAGTCTV